MSGVNFYVLQFPALEDTIQTNIPKSDSVQSNVNGLQHIDSISDQNVIKEKRTINLDAKSARKADTLMNVLKKSTEYQNKENSGNQNELSSKTETIDSTEKNNNITWSSAEDFYGFLYQNPKSFKTENDSIIKDTVATSTIVVQNKKSFFSQRIITNYDFVFWTFILLTFLFVWIQVFYRKYLINLFNSTISYLNSSKLFNEKNLLARRVSFVLNFIYTISMSLIVFRIAHYFGIEPDNFDNLSFFLVILNCIILFSILKTLFQKLIGFVFSSLPQINEYLHNVYVFNKSLGIIILPISVASFYTQHYIAEILIVIVVIMYVISLFLKIIRSFQIIIARDIFIFYMILYLCTLEFLPLLFGYKLIKSLS